MKRTLILALALPILAALTLNHVHALVNGTQDTVTIDEILVSGDNTWAQGVEVVSYVGCADHLFWQSEFLPGGNNEPLTSFSFSSVALRRERPRETFWLHINSGIGIYGPYPEQEQSHIRAIAGRTPPGGKNVETVYIKDYYELYPIRVDYFEERREVNYESLQEIFREFFRIPVHPEHRETISVEKYADGQIRSIGHGGSEDYALHFETDVAYNAEACFFTLTCQTSKSEMLDTSYIPGGFGIYRFPLKRDIKHTLYLEPGELENVFPLDVLKQQVVALHTDNEGNRLLLITLEADAYVLTVIDTTDFQQLQRIEFLSVDALEKQRGRKGFDRLYVFEDIIVPMTGAARFALLEGQADGLYELLFTADGEKEGEHQPFHWQHLTMVYDGERLALASVAGGGVDINLSIYTKNGLQYAGRYTHSLSKDLIDYDYQLRCWPRDDKAITLRWVNR